MKANMTHPPQEVLIKVMCSERLPEESGRYAVRISENGVIWQADFNAEDKTWKSGFASLAYTVNYWYEPATRIVLTEEEWETAMRNQYLAGYNENCTPSTNP